MKKNDILTGKVDTIGYNGEGVLHIDGTTVFVPFVLPNEKIRFKILKVKGNIAYGKVEEIIEPSADRRMPKCAVYKKCGGCQFQHLDYKRQIEYKAETVKECFRKIAGINVSVEKKFLSPEPYGYRNKMQLPIRSCDGTVKIGFFRTDSHDVVPADECPIQFPSSALVIKTIKDFIAQSGIPCYDEKTHGGLLRHVVTREINGEYIFVFVFTKDTKKFDNQLIEALSENFDKYSVFVNENGTDTNVILGEKYRKVFGKGEIALSEFGVDYAIGARSFFQVNTPVKREIYKDVFDKSGIDENTVVIDAFSGAGVLTAMLARRAKKAYGIEIVAEATAVADALAEKNGIKNMVNICAPCEDVLPELIKKTVCDGDKTLLVLDPPRSGVDGNSLMAIKAAKPDRIIYISCSPQTLARDVGVIEGTLRFEDGKLVNDRSSIDPDYEISFVGVYDIFAQTKHVETVCLLCKQ